MASSPGKQTYIFIALGASFALVCTATLTFVLVTALGQSTGKPTVRIGGNLSQDMAGATTNDSYKPSSQYVEKGADSDVTVFGFEGAKDSSTGRSIGESDIQKVMYSHQNGLIECYADGLEEDPDMAGRVDFHFRVAGDGHVGMVKITRSGLHDKGTEDCLVDEARRWKFPATKKAGYLKFDTHFNFMAE